MPLNLYLFRQIVLPLPLLAFGLSVLAPAARADAPAQTRQAIQRICDHAVSSYQRGDAAGFMANRTPGFAERSTGGEITTLRQEKAWQMKHITRKGLHKVIHCRVSEVTIQGSRAKAVLHWEFITYHPRSSSAPAYTLTRKYDEQTTWQKSPQGWLEASADMTHDILEYKR